jgi:ABC-2 type transport system permease protein
MKSPLAHVLGPKWRIAARRVFRRRKERGEGGRTALVLTVGAVFWVATFGILYRMLSYFQGVEGLGPVLAEKLLGLVLLTFLSILLLSNVIAGLSTFFLAHDLDLLLATPTERVHVYGARLAETLVHSSWMVALLTVPIVVAYERVFHAGPLFYLWALLALIPFWVIPAVLGSATVLALVNFFPARRAREILGVVTVAAAGGVVLLIRLLRPERLARPEGFRHLGEFLALLQTPTSPWLPSEWATETMIGHVNGGFDPFPLALLWSTAAGLVVLGAVWHDRFYPRGFSRAQEGAERYATSRLLGRWARAGLRPLGVTRTELVLKDVRAFFRDTTQWSQLILLGVLVLVYVYNIRALPLYTGERVSFFLINVVAFVNLGLAGFVLAAIAARFVFPSISLEGPTLWLLRSSPLPVRRLLWAKYWVGVVPLLILALVLTAATNALLKVTPFLMALSLVTIAALTFALCALALAAGAAYPQFGVENAAQIPTSFGGMVFMMSAVALLGAVVVLESWPILALFRQRLIGAPESTGAWVAVLLGFGGAVAICAAATAFGLRVALRKVEALGR